MLQKVNRNLKVGGVSKIGRNGNSKSITVPYRIFDMSGWEIGDEIEIYYDKMNNEIVIKRGGM